MNKKYILCVLLFIPGLTFSESFIEVGIIPFNNNWSIDEENYNNDNMLYVDFYTDYNISLFHVGGDIVTYCLIKNSELSFMPFFNEYEVFSYIDFGTIEVGISHRCMHPSNIEQGVVSPVMVKNAAFNKVYIKLKIGGQNK